MLATLVHLHRGPTPTANRLAPAHPVQCTTHPPFLTEYTLTERLPQVFNWYADLAIAASQAVKEANPQALVVGPAAAERSWYSDCNQSFLRQIFARGILEHLDAVSVHAYTEGPGRLYAVLCGCVGTAIQRY
jgi:hypothetical protein